MHWCYKILGVKGIDAISGRGRNDIRIIRKKIYIRHSLDVKERTAIDITGNSSEVKRKMDY